MVDLYHMGYFFEPTFTPLIFRRLNSKNVNVSRLTGGAFDNDKASLTIP
jgi:hypothetical protein